MSRSPTRIDIERERRRRRRARQYSASLVSYCRHRLGLMLWSEQIRMLEAIEAEDRVATRAGRKVSKSNSLVAAALWWAEARAARAFMTSSSAAQIRDILWKELDDLNTRRRLGLNVPINPHTGLHLFHGGNVVGRSTNKRENMQGYSGADVLYLVDEASGMDRSILEAIEGNLAGGGKLVMAGNPTRTSGPFFDAFHRERQFWKLIHIDAYSSPNITGEAAIVGLATRKWVEEMRQKHGDDSPFVDVHVRGNFPRQAANAVVTLGQVETARALYDAWDAGDEGEPEGALVLGVDVAWTGEDLSVIQAVRGRHAYPPEERHGMDPTDVAGWVLEVVRKMRRKLANGGHERPTVNVDVIGIGAGVYSNLLRSDEVHAVPINVAEKATAEPDPGEPSYHRLRDQLWFGIRDWMKAGGRLPPDEKLEGDLIAPTYTFGTRGEYKVSSKDEMKEILQRSPNNGDALGLAVYRDPGEFTMTVL